MTPTRHLLGLLSLSLLAIVPATAGCASAAPVEDDFDSSASEVRTARCPAAIDLALDKPTVASTTPTSYYDGSPLSGPEVGRVADGMTEARALDGIVLSLTLAEKKSGRCSYTTADASRRATFRTKSGRNILDVYYGKFRLYLFPTDYQTSGLTFDDPRPVTLFVNVAASGAYSDGASRNVAIGETKHAIGGALAADHAFLSALADDAGEYFDYEAGAYRDNVVPKALTALPQAIRDEAARLADAERESLRAGFDPEADAEARDEAYEVVKDGRTVGYVLPIDHAIDHGLWDGSGVYVFVDATGETVTSVHWEG